MRRTRRAEFNWLVSPSSTLSIVGGVGRSSFDVPHNEEQEEAGQDQRQTNLQTWQTASWQRAWSANTVSQVAGLSPLGFRGAARAASATRRCSSTPIDR